MAVETDLVDNTETAVTCNTNCLQDNNANHGQNNVCAITDTVYSAKKGEPTQNAGYDSTKPDALCIDRETLTATVYENMGLKDDNRYSENAERNDKADTCEVQRDSVEEIPENSKKMKDQGTQTEPTECACSCNNIQFVSDNKSKTEGNDNGFLNSSSSDNQPAVKTSDSENPVQKSGAVKSRFQVTPVAIEKESCEKTVDDNCPNKADSQYSNNLVENRNKGGYLTVPYTPTILINGVPVDHSSSSSNHAVDENEHNDQCINERTSLLGEQNTRDTSISHELHEAFSRSPTREEIRQLGHKFKHRCRSLRRASITSQTEMSVNSLPQEEPATRRLSRFTIVTIPEAAIEEDSDECVNLTQLTFTKEQRYFNEKILPKSRAKIPEVKIRPRPKDYFLLSCMTCLCCNPVIGGVALACAIGANAAFENGKTEVARKRGLCALQCSICAIVVTVVLVIFLILYIRSDIFLRWT